MGRGAGSRSGWQQHSQLRSPAVRSWFVCVVVVSNGGVCGGVVDPTSTPEYSHLIHFYSSKGFQDYLFIYLFFTVEAPKIGFRTVFWSGGKLCTRLSSLLFILIVCILWAMWAFAVSVYYLKAFCWFSVALKSYCSDWAGEGHDPVSLLRWTQIFDQCVMSVAVGIWNFIGDSY